MIPDIASIRSMTPQVVCLGLHPGIIQSMLDYEYLSDFQQTSIIAVIAGGRKQERFFWGIKEIVLTVHPDLESLPAATKEAINILICLQSARRVQESIEKSLAAFPNLKLATIFAEQVPERHAIRIAALAAERAVLVTGPASVGLLIPGVIKLGAIGGITPLQIEQANIIERGAVAVISTSGGMINELIHTVTGTNHRISFALAMGGDRFPLLDAAQAVLLAENDPETKAIAYFGELGGRDEYEIAQLIQEKRLTKPIYAYIAGEVASLFDEPPQFGHAKAMAKTENESAAAKKAALKQQGVYVADSFSEMEGFLALQPKAVAISMQHPRIIGERQRKFISSRLSGDIDGDVQLLGEDLLITVDKNSFESLVLSMLLGYPVNSPKLIDFTGYVLKLLVDHGPYVSGALNTIVTARAGKDLVSSLVSGLLTIGPRFGGAVNEAASVWLAAVASSKTAKVFVEDYKAHSGIIPGIGHKKYRIDLPDPRVSKLLQFSDNSSGRYVQFALEIQKITTSKKGNLILNVDGCIAAVMLDLLESELHLSTSELQALIDTEFFNALFVLSRSVGFMAHYMDQRRNDEGLLRLGDEHVSYIP